MIQENSTFFFLFMHSWVFRKSLVAEKFIFLIIILCSSVSLLLGQFGVFGSYFFLKEHLTLCLVTGVCLPPVFVSPSSSQSSWLSQM